MNIYQQIGKNNQSTWLLMAGFIAFCLLMGAGLDYYYGAGFKFPVYSGLALLIAVISSYSSYRFGDRLVLATTHAKPLNQSDLKQKQWQNVVEEMSIASGIPLPQTYVINDPDPNAFATGRNPEHSSIVITSGLLDILSRDELQAVAAHEMSHIKNYDIRLMLVVAVLVGTVALLADWAARGMFRGRRRSSDSGGGAGLIILVLWLAAIILAPILSRLIAMLVSRKREYLADASGAELTRNPLALASALEKLDSHSAPTHSINRGSAHLCMVDPEGRALNNKEGFLAELFATHPPIQKRIAALKQMAYVETEPANPSLLS